MSRTVGWLALAIGALLISISAPRVAQAQSLSVRAVLSAPDSTAAARVALLRPRLADSDPFAAGADTSTVRGPNYWAEGAAIGAIALGVPVAILGIGLCEGENCGSSVVLTSLGAAAAGAFIGAMIGGSVDKKPKATEAPR